MNNMSLVCQTKKNFVSNNKAEEYNNRNFVTVSSKSSLRGVMANILDCGLQVSEFEFQ